MKGTSLLAKACAAALFCTGAAWAENASGLIDSSKLNDKKVTDLQGNELGEIERLLVDPQSGQVQYAVIDVGTFLNQQGTEVAVPWQSLKVNREGGADNFKVQLDATKEKLQSAPRFSEAEADRLFTPSGDQVVRKYWTVTVTETRSPQQTQPHEQQQQGLPGSQPAPPTVETPSGESGKSTGPANYYERNRQATESSATEQNNYPAGQERETSTGTVTTPSSSSSGSQSPEPSPSTTPPTSSTSPTDTSEAKPAGPATDETDTSTSIPSEPSTSP